ncbi:MAG: 2-thiouracil desulfurase family protein [Methanotrichaceae archaeon]|nr:2-thiouracil desulfurase family protein [Methanotrichaceae archaeon]
MRHARPKMVISKCIEFDHSRYDGSLITNDFVKALIPHVDFTPVCAEMEIGLGVPRSAIRIVSENGDTRLVQPTTGLDVTEKMRSFCARFLDSLTGIDGFILKFRSPSCGIKNIRVYSSSAKPHTISKTSGFFGGAVVETFPHLAIEDEGRLRNFNIREHFLTKLYALSGLREIEN